MSNNKKTSSAIQQLGKVPANTRPPLPRTPYQLARNAQRRLARLSNALDLLETNSSAPEDGLQVDDEDLPF